MHKGVLALRQGPHKAVLPGGIGHVVGRLQRLAPQREVKAMPQHGCRGQGLAVHGRELIQPRLDQVLQAARQLLARVRQQLHQKERVALRTGHTLAAAFRIDLGKLIGQGQGIASAQGPQVEHTQRGVAQARAQVLAQRAAFLAGGEQPQHGLIARERHQRGQRVPELEVAPVQVFDAQQLGPLDGAPLQQAVQGQHHALVAHILAHGLVQACLHAGHRRARQGPQKEHAIGGQGQVQHRIVNGCGQLLGPARRHAHEAADQSPQRLMPVHGAKVAQLGLVRIHPLHTGQVDHLGLQARLAHTSHASQVDHMAALVVMQDLQDAVELAQLHGAPCQRSDGLVGREIRRDQDA